MDLLLKLLEEGDLAESVGEEDVAEAIILDVVFGLVIEQLDKVLLLKDVQHFLQVKAVHLRQLVRGRTQFAVDQHLVAKDPANQGGDM